MFDDPQTHYLGCMEAMAMKRNFREELKWQCIKYLVYHPNLDCKHLHHCLTVFALWQHPIQVLFDNSGMSIAIFMKGVSWKDSSLHRKSEVFGFAIHIPTGVNTMPVQQVGANGITFGFNFCRRGVISAEMVLLLKQSPESFRDVLCFHGWSPEEFVGLLFRHAN